MATAGKDDIQVPDAPNSADPSPRKPSLRRNILSLYVVQLSNYAVPLITLPWLTRVLGPDGFGRLSFCTAVNVYFILLADYGFNLSATREVAMHSHDRDARSMIFWNTITIKALLATIGFPVLLALTFGIARFSAERSLLLLGYLTVIGTVLTPTWYFQGVERQATLSTITIVIRLLSVPATFLLVTAHGDVYIAVAISAGTGVATGLVCLALLAREGALGKFAVTPAGLVKALQEGWHLFLSTASMSLYITTNTVLLGFVAGNTAVGHYSAAEKLSQVAHGLLVPVNQSVYPRISRLMNESRSAAFALIRKVLRVQAGLGLALSLSLFVLAPYLIRLLYGPAYEESVQVLRWLAPLPLVIGLSNVFGIHTMLPLGMKRGFTRILMSAGALNVLLLYALASWFGAVGAAMAVLATEALITVLMVTVLRRNGVALFRAETA